MSYQRKRVEPSWKRRPNKNSIFEIIKHLLKSPFRRLGYVTTPKFKLRLNTGAIIKKLAIFGVFCAMFGSLFLVAAFGFFSSQLPDVNSILSRFVAQSTRIYDRTGEVLLFELHGDEKRTIVELADISENIKNALIAAEDKNFYKHKGFSIIGIARSVIKNAFSDTKVGGSTLTQQMIKNTVLTNEKTYTRKIKELVMARKAEQNFSKDEILKIYLNTIGYGGVNYGVESASQAFFGKSSKDVSIAEAAILAAIPQAPTRLSPYGRNVTMLMARKDWVLERMREEGYITKEEERQAREQEIVFKKQELRNIKAPHFVFYVRELLAAEFGEEIMNQGGLKVITTLDWEKQGFAEEAVTTQKELIISKGGSNASLVSLDAKTGEILAMVGSMDYFDDEIHGKVNVSIEKRQPGSSLKPIVYASAIAKGFTSETVVYDVNTNFAVSGTPYEPKNYNLKEHGPVTFRKALQGSLNIAAVKALYLAGVDNVMKKMEEDLGYHTITSDLDCGLSLVLGGCEVTLLDHVAAHTAFARDGEYSAPAAILEVFDSRGEKLFQFEPNKKKVWDEQTARTMNNILSDNEARSFVFGPNSHLQMGSRPVAAKTGTTNDYNDAWTVGYTPSFVTGVWVGNADGKDMSSGADGSVVAAPIWKNYMTKMLGNGPVEQFKSPDPFPTDLKPVLMGTIGGQAEVEVDKFSGKLATEYTPESAKEKRVYTQHHDILHFVNKDDPRGPVPSDPNRDPAYSQWERYIQEWVYRDFENRRNETLAKGLPFEEKLTDGSPPTEYDDVHGPQFMPSVVILSPTNNQIIESSQLLVTIQASAPRNIVRTEVYLGDVSLGIMNGSQNSASFNLPALTPGYHKLKLVVFDDVDNSNEQSIDINIRTSGQNASLTWISPDPSKMYTTSDFPLPIALNLSSISNISSVTIISSDLSNNGNIQNLSTFSNLTGTSLSTTWVGTTPGSYRIYAEITDTDGNKTITSSIVVTVN